MKRATSYLLLIIGAVLGYIGSYFGQPGFPRAFASLGDYLGKARDILWPSGSNPAVGEQFFRSVCLTAWIGTILGVILMCGVIMYIQSTANKSPKA